MGYINRCNVCRAILRFHGIDNRRTGWVRWQVCPNCGVYHADNLISYVYIGKKAPSKSIFRSVEE